MKISYFFMACFLLVSLSIQSNVIDDIKSWWNAKSEVKKQAAYESAQGHVGKVLSNEFLQKKLNEAYPSDYLQKAIVEPNADYAYDHVTKRLANDFEKIKTSAIKKAGATAAVAVVGAATYGLYRWLTRRGMGAITNGFSAIDTKVTTVFEQIDSKISDFTLKRPRSIEDKKTAKALLLTIASKIKDWTANVAKLTGRQQALNEALDPKENRR